MQVLTAIPVYNEERHVEKVLAEVRRYSPSILVVNDGSTDGTAEVLRGLSGITALAHERNAGKGAALTTGFRAATGDIILIQDADLEYDPNDYAAVIRPIVEGRSDAVLGSRFILYKPKFLGTRRSPYLSHYIGNMLVTSVTNLLYGQRFTDYEGCYKAFRRAVVTATPITAQGFEFDNELICKLMRKGTRIVEVPIRYSPRTYETGKKITWRHGVIMLWTIAKWRFLPF